MANTKGHMISLVTRMLIVFVVVGFILAVVAILLVQKYGTMWVIAPIIIVGALAIATSYLYWRPRYKRALAG